MQSRLFPTYSELLCFSLTLNKTTSVFAIACLCFWQSTLRKARLKISWLPKKIDLDLSLGLSSNYCLLLMRVVFKLLLCMLFKCGSFTSSALNMYSFLSRL